MKFVRRFGILAMICAAGLWISACESETSGDEDNAGPEPAAATVTAVSVSGTNAVAATGNTTLSAAVTMSDNSTYSGTISWTITSGGDYATLSAATGASVTLTGKNTTTAAKTVTVKASAGGKEGSYSVTVGGVTVAPGSGTEETTVTHTVTISGSKATDEENWFTVTGAATNGCKINSSGNIAFTTTKAATVKVTSVYSNTTASSTSQWGVFKDGEASATVTGPSHSNTTTADTSEYEESVELTEAGTYKIARASGGSKEFYIVKVVVIEGSSSGSGSGGGSGGDDSGSGGNPTPSTENVIKATDKPLGFAGVNYTQPSFSKTVTVTTRAELMNAIKNSNVLIYVNGMIDMSDEGSGSKLPDEGASNIAVSSVMDSWISSKTSGAYTTYKAWVDAYAEACSTSTNDKDASPTKGAHSSLYDTLWSLNNAWKSVIQLNLKSNTTIIGLGENSGIRGGTISIADVSNVVIRNLTLIDAIDMFPHHEYDDGFNSQFDCITIQGDKTTSNIWIDHCTMKDTLVMQHVEYGTKEKWQNYDGLCDIKGLGAGITVSNCHMYHHDKTMLVGSSDSEGDNTTRKVSIINNHFDSCVQRLPMARNSQFHVLNNWYSFDTTQSVGDGKSKGDYCIGARKGALIIAEANYFDSNMSYSISGNSSTASTAKVYETGSVDKNKKKTAEYTAVSSAPFTVPYTYTAMTAEEAKTYAGTNAGAGKWTVEQ